MANLSSALPNSPRHEPIPPILPELELIEQIGSGGYGEVWLCRNVVGTLRAVKIVRRAEFDDERPYEREFNGIRKFEPISRTHEGFVNILQIGRNETEGFFYYVMELADSIHVGDEVTSLTSNSNASPILETSETPHVVSYIPRTLASEVKARGALPLPECVTIAIPLVQALAELHRHGLVHRDIKPSNIIFVNGAPKLADIGLVASATDSRSFVGTEGFIPPEGPGSVQADLYSLGILLYVIATGQHHRDFPEPPAGLASRPDRAQLLELTAIIHRACQTNPRDRYQSATGLLADLELLQSGHSIKRRHSIQRFGLLTAKISAPVLIAALFFFLLLQFKSPDATKNIPLWQAEGAASEAAWQTRKRGAQMINPYTVSSMSNAVMEFERALKLDPNYGRAWGGLAMAHVLAVEFGYVPATNFLPLAQRQAQKAIDNNIPYGYMPLALSKLGMDFDFASIEPMFRKAFELDPVEWALRSNFSRHLIYSGRFAEAENLMNQILQQHPDGAGTYGVTLAWLYGATDRVPQAIAALDTAIRLDPARPSVYLLRGEFRLSTNERAIGMRDLLRTVELEGFASLDPVIDGAILRKVFEDQGPEEFLRRLIQLLEERKNSGRWVYSFDLARLHAHAGNRGRALDYLELALEERGGMLRSAKVIPAFKSLHDEPRFKAILRRLNLEN